MDPKMDAGYLEPGEAFDDELNLAQDHLPEEVIGIMDQLLCFEMSWHQGWPLAQNLFTSLHIDNLLSQKLEPHVLPHFLPKYTSATVPPLISVVLRSFCLGLIKSCDLVILLMQSQLYYEEEDFNTNNFNRDLLTTISVQQCNDALAEAADWVKKESGMGESLQNALQCRLDCRQDMLAFFEVVAPLDEQPAFWSKGRDVLQCVEETHEYGIPQPNVFSSKLQRKLASTVPPRPVKDLPFAEACATIRQLLDDNEYLVQLEKCVSSIRLEPAMVWCC